MRKAIATVSVSGVLADKLEAIAAAGFDGIELFDNDLSSRPSRRARCAPGARTWGCGSSCSSRCVTSRGCRPSGSSRCCTGSAPSSV